MSEPQTQYTIHKAVIAFVMALLALIAARFGWGEAPSAETIGQLLIDLIAVLVGSVAVAGGVWWQKNHPKPPA